MPVHQISDSAQAILEKLAKEQGVKPAQALNQLLWDYDEGLRFKGDKG